MIARTSASNLAQAIKRLRADWEETRDDWRDAQAVYFQETFLDPLPTDVSRTISALEELDALLQKVRSDCE